MSEDDRRELRAGRQLSDAQRVAWLRLIRSENVGPVTFRQLINHFGSAVAALQALPDLARRGGKRGLAIMSVAEAEREMATAARFNARFVALGEADYPPLLATVEGPPPLLAVRGGSAVLTRSMVAIVGARNASIAGRKLAGMIARGLGEGGFVVVSGLARGIDAEAHAAALQTGTVAVVAGGLDRLYPPENEDLHDAILAHDGAVVTEMPFGFVARAKEFPRRNRLVSGMSLGVVVVEAAARSGTLHTARFAAEQGREVLAVPGSPLDPRSEGTNRLIREGATLVTSAADVIEALAPLIGRRPPPPDVGEREEGEFQMVLDAPESARQKILESLSVTPVALDEIIRMTGLTPAQVHLVLLELDLAGRLERHPGGTISLIL